MKRAAILAILMVTAAFAAQAGPLRDRLEKRMAERAPAQPLPAGIEQIRDVAYGSDAKQRLDIFRISDSRNAPAIVMVHGGGWRRGDKSMSRVTDNKVTRWVPKGVVFISVNYRMLPEAKVDNQLDDFGRALAYIK